MVLFWKYFRDGAVFYVGRMHVASRNGESSTDDPHGSGLANSTGDFVPAGHASLSGELAPMSPYAVAT